MIISEAADRVLSILEQTDEEEYSLNHAIQDVQQAIFELSEENEFRFMSKVTNYTLATPESGEEPDFWLEQPGRALLTEVLSSTWSEIAYIKRGWIDVDGDTYPFAERDLSELFDTFGDTEGTPESFAIDGEYLWWRPMSAAGVERVARFHWQSMKPNETAGSEPIILAQVPYAVIYKACAIASIWLLDDTRVPMFEAQAMRAYERYNARYAMTGDGPRAMGEFNG